MALAHFDHGSLQDHTAKPSSTTGSREPTCTGSAGVLDSVVVIQHRQQLHTTRRQSACYQDCRGRGRHPKHWRNPRPYILTVYPPVGSCVCRALLPPGSAGPGCTTHSPRPAAQRSATGQAGQKSRPGLISTMPHRRQLSPLVVHCLCQNLLPSACNLFSFFSPRKHGILLT